MLILFQFVSVQIALGFYTNPMRLETSQQKTNLSDKKVISKIGYPVRIKIPSLKISALIQSVGLTPQGYMGIPELPKDTAWYKLGPKPGETGSAVIAGHLDWWYGATGVFANLSKLKPGQKILIEDEHGKTTSFIVREQRSMNQTADASSVFLSSDGKSHLNLVTCGGAWNKTTKSYAKRIVIFADKEGE